MRLCWLTLGVGLAGCDRLFGLTDVVIPVGDAAGSDSTVGESCPTSYEMYGGGRYKLVRSPLAWEAAESDCVDDSMTAITHLVVFDDVAELMAMQSYLVDRQMTNDWWVHAGYAHDTLQNPDVFYSVTGDQIDAGSALWDRSATIDEPNGTTGLDEETVTSFGRTVMLADVKYTLSAPYVCECDHRQATRMFTLH